MTVGREARDSSVGPEYVLEDCRRVLARVVREATEIGKADDPHYVAGTESTTSGVDAIAHAGSGVRRLEFMPGARDQERSRRRVQAEGCLDRRRDLSATLYVGLDRIGKVGAPRANATQVDHR